MQTLQVVIALYFYSILSFGFTSFKKIGSADYKLRMKIKSPYLRLSWSDSIIPRNYDEIEKNMQDSLKTALFVYDRKNVVSSASSLMLSVDLLSPGLNPKLEQKAMLQQDLLFGLVTALFPVISEKFKSIKILFPSTGDAAGYMKFTRRNRINLSDNIIPTELGIDRLTSEDDCAIFVTAKNHLGDPVINEVEEISLTFPKLTCILLNSDLSDRVTSGLETKKKRNAFRASIIPAFYFRNIVRIERPSLEPIEMGALRYQFPSLLSQSSSETLPSPQDILMKTKWELYSAEGGERMTGPGTLNRFMKTPAFRRTPGEASMDFPPLFKLIRSFDAYPNREEVSDSMEKARNEMAKLQRELESQRLSDGRRRPEGLAGTGGLSDADIASADLDVITSILIQAAASRSVLAVSLTAALDRLTDIYRSKNSPTLAIASTEAPDEVAAYISSPVGFVAAPKTMSISEASGEPNFVTASRASSSSTSTSTTSSGIGLIDMGSGSEMSPTNPSSSPDRSSSLSRISIPSRKIDILGENGDPNALRAPPVDVIFNKDWVPVFQSSSYVTEGPVRSTLRLSRTDSRTSSGKAEYTSKMLFMQVGQQSGGWNIASDGNGNYNLFRIDGLPALIANENKRGTATELRLILLSNTVLVTKCENSGLIDDVVLWKSE